MWVVYLTVPSFGLAYMQVYDRIVKLIEELDPAMVVVDGLLSPGIDACHSLNRRHVLNSPNTATDAGRMQQPWLKGFWYYPAFVFLSTLIQKFQLSCSSLDQPGQWNTIPGLVEGSPRKYSGASNAHIRDSHVSRDLGTRQVPQRPRYPRSVTRGNSRYPCTPYHLFLCP